MTQGAKADQESLTDQHNVFDKPPGIYVIRLCLITPAYSLLDPPILKRYTIVATMLELMTLGPVFLDLEDVLKFALAQPMAMFNGRE
jgi:hypothetical protein